MTGAAATDPASELDAIRTVIADDHPAFREGLRLLLDSDAIEVIELQLRSSEALAITGPNGSGKSTLAMLVAGLLVPRVGSVLAAEALFAGHGHEPIARWPARELVRRIGTVFQDPEHLVGGFAGGAHNKNVAEFFFVFFISFS